MEPSRKKMRMTLRSDSKKLDVQPRLKLPKLPFLVQRNLIKMMTPSEQYLLSKCSKRTCQMVKNFMPKENNHEIWVDFDQEVDYWRKRVTQFYLKNAENIMFIHTSLGDFSPEDHKYICDLFRAPSEVYAIWQETNSFSEDFPRNCAIKRTNLLKQQLVRLRELKEFFKQHPSQDLVLLYGASMRTLDRNCTFLGARNLMFSSIEGNSPISFLSSFHGENLLMENVFICKFVIEVFVDSWMKKSNDRLKTVIFKLDPECVIRDLKYKKCSGSDMKFQYDSLIKDYHKFPIGMFDCIGGYEVRRDTDGKVATIKITRDYFLFLIW